MKGNNNNVDSTSQSNHSTVRSIFKWRVALDKRVGSVKDKRVLCRVPHVSRFSRRGPPQARKVLNLTDARTYWRHGYLS